MDRHYLLYSFAQSVRIPIHAFDKDLKCTFPLDFRYRHDLFASDPGLAEHMYRTHAGRVVMEQDPVTSKISYDIFFADQDMIVIGPCAVQPLTPPEKHAFLEEHRLPADFPVAVRPSHTLFHAMECLRHILTGERTPLDTILRNSRLLEEQQKELLEGLTQQTFEDSLLEDAPLLGEPAIEFTGYDEDYLTRYGNVAVPEFVEQTQRLIRKSPELLRSYTAIALYQQKESAQAEGLGSRQAQDVLDFYLRRLNHCQTDQAVIRLHYDCLQQYRELSANADAALPSDILKCEDFIRSHLHRKITLTDAAEHLGFAPAYLSAKFKKYTGSTFAAFYRRCRLEGSANMLRYSEYSYSDIADYFCFSSQSRFIEQFKEQYGCTPAVYRNQNLKP